MHDANDSRHPISNRLLAVLPPTEFAFIQPHLKEVVYEPGTMLARAGDTLRTCFFPNGGMVSLLCVTEQGRSVEAGFTGFEGMIGVSVILRKNEMPYDALVQASTPGVYSGCQGRSRSLQPRRRFSRRYAPLCIRHSQANVADMCLQSLPHDRISALPLAYRDVRTIKQPSPQSDAGISRSHARRSTNQHRNDREFDPEDRCDPIRSRPCRDNRPRTHPSFLRATATGSFAKNRTNILQIVTSLCRTSDRQMSAT
jgi:hypothetical protein